MPTENVLTIKSPLERLRQTIEQNTRLREESRLLLRHVEWVARQHKRELRRAAYLLAEDRARRQNPEPPTDV